MVGPTHPAAGLRRRPACGATAPTTRTAPPSDGKSRPLPVVAVWAASVSQRASPLGIRYDIEVTSHRQSLISAMAKRRAAASDKRAAARLTWSGPDPGEHIATLPGELRMSVATPVSSEAAPMAEVAEHTELVTSGPADALAGLLGAAGPDLEADRGLPLLRHLAVLARRAGHRRASRNDGIPPALSRPPSKRSKPNNRVGSRCPRIVRFRSSACPPAVSPRSEPAA